MHLSPTSALNTWKEPRSTIVEGRESFGASFFTSLRLYVYSLVLCWQVDYETRDNTALAGNDYAHSAGKVIFESGQKTSKVRTKA
jgi:hypothetical protein